MIDNAADMKLRLAAAAALMPYVHAKTSGTSKKEEAQAAAKKAGSGRFGTASPPALSSVKN
ncbi:MAG: hypothetical protein Q7T78_04430 [Rhodoferax sp.]|nr:hypothetical protein [Rhodoferax sp.]